MAGSAAKECSGAVVSVSDNVSKPVELASLVSVSASRLVSRLEPPTSLVFDACVTILLLRWSNVILSADQEDSAIIRVGCPRRFSVDCNLSNTCLQRKTRTAQGERRDRPEYAKNLQQRITSEARFPRKVQLKRKISRKSSSTSENRKPTAQYTIL
jgi:hypothetical protein